MQDRKFFYMLVLSHRPQVLIKSIGSSAEFVGINPGGSRWPMEMWKSPAKERAGLFHIPTGPIEFFFLLKVKDKEQERNNVSSTTF